jgi:hypothetical protein
MKFRWLVDVPTSDTGHSLRMVLSGGVAGYMIWKILGNGIIQCQINANTRINEAGLTPGDLTVMGYATGSGVYLKAKDGHDPNMSWTTWDGSDADAFGSYTETFGLADMDFAIGAGNDTSPLTHGWTKSLELMLNTYVSWED